MMALHEAEYLLPSVDSLDGPLDLSCGIIAPREDSEEEDEALGMPDLLPPPPSPSSVVQEELGIQSCLPLGHQLSLRSHKSPSVTWVHFGSLTPSPPSPDLTEEVAVKREPLEAATAAMAEEEVAEVDVKAKKPRCLQKKAASEARAPAAEETVDPLRCEHCSFRARNRHSLNNHHRQRHRDERFRHMRQCQRCPVSGCSVTKFHSSRMVQHLNADHGARIQKVQLYFNSTEEFIRWKQAEERKVGVTFTKRTGDRHGPHMRATNYTCSRFGTQMHRYAGTSRSLRLGSGQTDDYCPSRMNVVFYDNRLMVVYFRKHSHDVAAGPDYWVDLKSLPLPPNPQTVEKFAHRGGQAVKRVIGGRNSDKTAAEECPEVTDSLPPKRSYPHSFKSPLSPGMAKTQSNNRSLTSTPSPSFEPPPSAPPRIYSSLCDTLRAQMETLGESLRQGIPEGLLESVMELHGVNARLLQQLQIRKREKRVFPLVLQQTKAP